MKKTLALLVATTAVGFASSAYAANAQVKSKVEYKKDGGYEASRTAERTTENGTALSSDSKIDVEVDSKGRVDKTVAAESKTDAKGLMNAKKEKTKVQIKEKANGGYKQVTKKSSSDAAGTDINNTATKDVDVDANGNVTTTETTEKTVDPKGLVNEKKSSEKVKSVNGVVVDHTKKAD